MSINYQDSEARRATNDVRRIHEKSMLTGNSLQQDLSVGHQQLNPFAAPMTLNLQYNYVDHKSLHRQVPTWDGKHDTAPSFFKSLED